MRCCVDLHNKKPDAYHAAHDEPLGSELPGCNYLDHIFTFGLYGSQSDSLFQQNVYQAGDVAKTSGND